MINTAMRKMSCDNWRRTDLSQVSDLVQQKLPGLDHRVVPDQSLIRIAAGYVAPPISRKVLTMKTLCYRQIMIQQVYEGGSSASSTITDTEGARSTLGNNISVSSGFSHRTPQAPKSFVVELRRRSTTRVPIGRRFVLINHHGSEDYTKRPVVLCSEALPKSACEALLLFRCQASSAAVQCSRR